jgi:hypothetical protein
MTREQFFEQLGRLSADDPVGVTSLAKNVMDDAREAVRTAVEVWLGIDPQQAQKAKSVLAELEELAFVPLTERGDPMEAERRVWLLRNAGNSQMGLRAKYIALINRMLDDRRQTVAPRIAGPPMEENPPMPRVCDEAYLAHRQLLNFAESREQYYANARAFLALPEAKRDEEIRNLRKTNMWTRLASK